MQLTYVLPLTVEVLRSLDSQYPITRLQTCDKPHTHANMRLTQSESYTPVKTYRRITKASIRYIPFPTALELRVAGYLMSILSGFYFKQLLYKPSPMTLLNVLFAGLTYLVTGIVILSIAQKMTRILKRYRKPKITAHPEHNPIKEIKPE